MDEDTLRRFVEALDVATVALQEAFEIIDEVEGLTDAGSLAFVAAQASLDGLRTAEISYYNARGVHA